MERIQRANPFYVFGHGEEKAKSPIKFKKRRIKINRGEASMAHSPSQMSMGSAVHENMMRINVEQEIKELPG